MTDKNISDAPIGAVVKARATEAEESEQRVERWYMGAMNDAVFIINTPPRPSNDDVWHDRPDGPTLVLATWPLEHAKVQAIVDAHNAVLDTERRPAQAGATPTDVDRKVNARGSSDGDQT